MLYLSRQDVFNLLTHETAIEACEEGLKQEGRDEVWSVPRIQRNLEKGWIRFMPAAAAGYVGLRVYGRWILYILWDGREGRPLVMMDALGLRDIRTGAVGAVGAKYLARDKADEVGVIGSGAIARQGLASLAKVRRVGRVKVFSPTKDHREDFARTMSQQLKLDIAAVDSAEAAVTHSDVIITGAGRHAEPIFKGAWLKPGAFVMGIGMKDELDDETVTRSKKIVIDSKAQFEYECKDITSQVAKGLIRWDDVAELHEVLTGRKPGRTSADEITLLKTTGTAVQDLFPAIKLYEKAVAEKAGKEMGDLFPPAHGWWSAKAKT
jgi:ornithine cyclodeaminase/alanine dehydrogenase-like protein (mu-crystallin family)